MREQEDILISIVIPVYNVENYITDCLSSVIPQLQRQYEVIIIDDGSIDESYKLCKEHVMKTQGQNIQLFHQSNYGLSVTRNRGIQYAKGEYVMFLDSDDALEQNALEKLENTIHQYSNLDIVLFDSKIWNEMNLSVSEKMYYRKDKVPSLKMTGSEYFLSYYWKEGVDSACMRLYRRNFLVENKLYFAKGKLHEDNEHSFKATWLAKGIFYLAEELYLRRYRENSIMTMPRTKKHILDLMYAMKNGLNFAMQQKDIETVKFKNTISGYYVWLCKSLVEQAEVMGIDAEESEALLEAYGEFLRCYKEKERGYTFYAILEQVLKICIAQENYIRQNSLQWLFFLIETSNLKKAEEEIRQKKEWWRNKICSELPLYDKKKSVGVYGLGVHSKGILNCCEEQKGELLSRVFFIDSSKKSYSERFGEYEIVNIKDIPSNVDYVIISSYAYRLEILKRIEDNNIQEKTEVIDLYETERFPLF